MGAYSLDLRERVLADCDAGHCNDEVARKYRVSASWIRRLKQRRRETGSIAPRQRQAPPPQWTAHTVEICHAVEVQPDTTLKELRQALGLKLSEPTLCRALRKLRLSWKKKSCVPRNKIGPMLRPGATNGKRRCGRSRSNVLSSSMKPARTRG